MTIQYQQIEDVDLKIDEPSIEVSFDEWAFEMNAEEEAAADKILEYLIQSGSRPYINVTGDIVEIVTSITNTMTMSVPPHLAHPLKIMTDYIARWLCDYIEKTNISSLSISFGFDAKLPTKEIV